MHIRYKPHIIILYTYYILTYTYSDIDQFWADEITGPEIHARYFARNIPGIVYELHIYIYEYICYVILLYYIVVYYTTTILYSITSFILFFLHYTV